MILKPFYVMTSAVHKAVVKFNPDGTFHGRKRSGRPRKVTPRENCLMRQTVMRLPIQRTPAKKSCYLPLKRYSNRFQHCFETSQQRIWSEVRQAGTKATPDTRYGLCRTSSPSDSD